MSTGPTPSNAGSTQSQGAAGPSRAGFVVKLRDGATRSWGNETEVFAASAQDAAEIVAAQPLSSGPGSREHLRARVWKLPYGTVPEVHFYLPPSEAAETPAG